MTLVSRSLARTAALALAAAMALSACSTSEPADPPTSASSSTTGATSPSPSESTPAPGEWTLDDLKVGAQVPKEDLERLFPKWAKPTPPATLTEQSEQGAKDAAVYFDELVDLAFYSSNPSYINEIDDGHCENCEELRNGITGDTAIRVYALRPELEEISAHQMEDAEHAYEIRIGRKIPVGIDQDFATKKLTEINFDSRDEVYYYLLFADNRWTTVYAKMDGSLFK
ncbi:hypothetical protein SAMN02910418_02422 [Bowdeniella nasicola]|uniref:Lipoprotein n=1 Tax=Bowdeniella nasicola TaxID=208480 RepID=A0A1H4E290_9ACTO|nr:DUF6318 family protein [Bowdeniella nasicola]SEA78937.1 hypothetical protein SAMN02910418_02422 [Bowdeniella nasicola]